MSIYDFGFSEVKLPIFAPYRFEKIDGKEMIMGSQKKGRQPERYNPLVKMDMIIKDCKAIYTLRKKNIKTGLSRSEHIIEFCNLWGLLGIFEAQSQGLSSLQLDDSFSNNAPFSQSVEGFSCAIRQIISTYLIMLKINEQGINIVTTADEVALSLSINSLLKGVEIRITPTDKSFVAGYEYDSLANAIGIYFYDKLLRKKSMRECLFCGNLFEPTRFNQKFCPPEQMRPKSDCKARYESKNNREKQKRVKSMKKLGTNKIDASHFE